MTFTTKVEVEAKQNKNSKETIVKNTSNLLLLTDSYKVSHKKQYPFGK